MNGEWQFTTAYLRNLDGHLRDELRNRRVTWGFGVDEFYKKIEGWFANFAESDQPLALKLLLKLQYYSQDAFKRGINNFFIQIQQYLCTTGGELGDVRLVVPPSRADSADRHAYDIIKEWGLRQDQVVTVDALAEVPPRCVLVFFNDTHGTGNQFLREVFSQVRKDDFQAVFVVAMTIAERALLRFNRELEGVRVLPDVPTPSIFDEFTYREVNRLRELGARVYPKHPFGYGDAGLLVAYSFQCPNNTLPLIWASDSHENNRVDGKAFRWTPLFPYVPKPKAVQPATVVAPPEPAPDPALLDGGWAWTDDERRNIVDHIAQWRLATPAFYRTVGAWFRNFRPDERAAALELFLSTSYLDIARIRNVIRALGKDLMARLGRVGGDMGDVILVTTGDEKASVYHYMYEFMREWHLSVDQVCSLDRLGPDRVIDKTLVFFYHTRANGRHFEKHHAQRLATLTPRATMFAAYAMSEEAKARFRGLKTKSPIDVLNDPGAAATVDRLVGPDTRNVMARIESELRPGSDTSAPDNTFLTAYYFQCPADSSPLLWLDQDGLEDKRAWVPLFRRIAMPQNDL